MILTGSSAGPERCDKAEALTEDAGSEREIHLSMVTLHLRPLHKQNCQDLLLVMQNQHQHLDTLKFCFYIQQFKSNERITAFTNN